MNDMLQFDKGDVKYMTNDNNVRFTFRIPIKLLSFLKDEARRHGVSTNAMILEILRGWKQRETVKHDARHTG
jgi:predicted HicB family RNase H-like nuclease